MIETILGLALVGSVGGGAYYFYKHHTLSSYSLFIEEELHTLYHDLEDSLAKDDVSFKNDVKGMVSKLSKFFGH